MTLIMDIWRNSGIRKFPDEPNRGTYGPFPCPEALAEKCRALELSVPLVPHTSLGLNRENDRYSRPTLGSPPNTGIWGTCTGAAAGVALGGLIVEVPGSSNSPVT